MMDLDERVLNDPDPAKRRAGHAVLAAGQAGEQRYHLGPDEQSPNAVMDKHMSKELAEKWGEYPHAAWKEGRQKAQELLNGELADQHTKLTDYIKQNWGKTMQFEDFAHLLKGLGVAAAPALSKLWINYQGKNVGPKTQQGALSGRP